MFASIIENKKPILKLLYFFLIVFCCLLFVNVIGTLLTVLFWGASPAESFSGSYDYSDESVVGWLKYLQILNQLGLFIIPVLIFSHLAGGNISGYLKLNGRIPLLPFIAGICIITLGLPLINWLTEINRALKLPESFSAIETWMRNSEKNAEELTSAFLSTRTLGGLAINMLMIAVLPALGEEFFFRGVFQRLLGEWFKNAHIAIFVTAFVFSSFHLQFYGFLPRFLLGVFLGYLFYWTGNLWVPIIVHFINNGMAVVVAWLSEKGIINIHFETFGSSDNIFVIAGSGIFVVLFIYLIYINRIPKT